jgi:uncharacterized protein (DUF433 family)
MGELGWSECAAVGRAPGALSAEWLFKGTRVPVRAVLENLGRNARVDDFLAWFRGRDARTGRACARHAGRNPQ